MSCIIRKIPEERVKTPVFSDLFWRKKNANTETQLYKKNSNQKLQESFTWGTELKKEYKVGVFFAVKGEAFFNKKTKGLQLLTSISPENEMCDNYNIDRTEKSPHPKEKERKKPFK